MSSSRPIPVSQCNSGFLCTSDTNQNSCRRRAHRKFAIAKESLPLRVIDVPATLERRNWGSLAFIEPIDWDFHVLSHTWSKSIRELSEKVGKSIQLIGTRDQHDPQSMYNDAFKEANFSSEPGYQHLITLLELLVQEGVDKLWFDALCINQADAENSPAIAISEKEREIMNMGAFYTHSAGCYVINHGLGKGFDLVDRDDHGRVCLPRWFTRVWTLQEFLLPSKLTFLVSGSSLGITSLIEELAPVKSCKLCINKTSPGGAAAVRHTHPDEQIEEYHSMRQQNPDRRNADIKYMMKMVLCTTCHPDLPLIRKSCKDASYTDQQIYLVDRQAYFCIVWLQYGPPSPYSGHTFWQVTFQELFYLLDMCYVCSSSRLFHLVQRRSCTEEEDRILSILPLLGLHGKNMMQQVRTKQTLEEQILKVASTLSVINPKLLLHLCIKDIICSTNKAGMSWIPNLRPNFLPKDEDTTSIDSVMSTFTRNIWCLDNAKVQLKEVRRDEGALRLEGNVMGARIVAGARGAMQQHFNEVDCRTCIRTGSFDSPETTLVHQTMDCHLEVPQANVSIPLLAHAFQTATVRGPEVAIRQKGCIIRLSSTQPKDDLCLDCAETFATGGIHIPIPCLHFLVSVNVSLLLWGEEEDGSTIVMVCMGTTDIQLHKIGVLNLKSDVADAIFSSNKLTSEYLLGGFETKDVREFWRNWGLVHSVQCNCHGTVTIKAFRSFLGNLKTRLKFDRCPKYSANPKLAAMIGPYPGLSLMTTSCSSHQKCAHGVHDLQAQRRKLFRRAVLSFKRGSPIPLEARANPDHVILGFGSALEKSLGNEGMDVQE